MEQNYQQIKMIYCPHTFLFSSTWIWGQGKLITFLIKLFFDWDHAFVLWRLGFLEVWLQNDALLKKEPALHTYKYQN